MSPLLAALNTIEPETADPQNNRRGALLLTLYAVVAEAAKNSSLQNEDKDDARVAADSRAYARIMKEIENVKGQAPTVLGRVSQGTQYVDQLPSKRK